ncbi:MAG: IMPACT family protein [Bacteroidales bacterium]|jgi:uncharacterized YigZ family protein|nr:IMPACT family protein [Bacteroidales bacterium]
MFDNCYQTIKEPTSGLFKDKGSRFIGFAYPVKTEAEIKAILAEVKKKYHDATHHCYAYLLGGWGTPLYRLNDDGEPSATAGKPIYGQIISRNLKNILVIVVRYFGGIKLGVSGLINAYKETTAITLNNAQIITLKIYKKYKIQFEYSLMNTIMQILKSPQVEIVDNNYKDSSVIIDFKVVIDFSEQIATQLEKVYGAKLEFICVE